MQFEFLANVEYWCREQEIKDRLHHERNIRECKHADCEEPKRRRNRLRELLHLS